MFENIVKTDSVIITRIEEIGHFDRSLLKLPAKYFKK